MRMLEGHWSFYDNQPGVFDVDAFPKPTATVNESCRSLSVAKRRHRRMAELNPVELSRRDHISGMLLSRLFVDSVVS